MKQNDAISRFDLIHKNRVLWDVCVDGWPAHVVTLDEVIDAPALDVPQVVHAMWIPRYQSDGTESMYCSHCYTDRQVEDMLFCPHCGARMDAQEDEKTEK